MSAYDLDDFVWGKRLEGGDSGLGDGGDGVVVVTDAILFVDEFEAMGEGLEFFERGLGLFPCDAQATGGGECALGVDLVVYAWDF